ncbi:DUF4190 domain-containing protein [Sinomonas sp. ASV322]|uniref:DUF4190 domain-containing protein n=1 Tax=Sinomonas sp. ASV322 TaxID=3041920 RepID=UPI0027DB0002|nr:DUF4190 domain-containing protein [Sinomonas sp. ASV322]MDQ4503732.1 DUF4190 domain-containing protein [Sinomonas sp. ASV322]
MTQPPHYQAPDAPAFTPYDWRVGTNTLAIVSLIGAFFIPIVGVITGFIALGQIKRTGENGRGLAIAGIIIGIAGTVLWSLVVVLSILVSLSTTTF